jgi:hypothetical protein
MQVLVLLSLLGGVFDCPRIYGRRASVFPIPRDSNIFIEPIDGFGSELKTAYLSEGVPLDIVSDRRMADFVITGAIKGVTATRKTPEIDIRIENLRTQSVVWGFGAAEMPDARSVAASCAKQLKREMARQP